MNLIIVMLDTLRPDHVGCYGNKWIKTPNLDKIAKECMVFDRLVPESLPTIEVRRAMLTGKRLFPFNTSFFPTDKKEYEAGANFWAAPRSHIPGWEPIPWNQVTLPEMLEGLEMIGTMDGERIMKKLKPAYHTALITDTAPYFSNYAMNYHRGFYHWDFVRGQSMDFYGVPALAEQVDVERYIPSWAQRDLSLGHFKRFMSNASKWRGEEDQFAAQVFARSAQWLEDNQGAEDPFFLLADSWDPHEPWIPPQKYIDLYDDGKANLSFEPVKPLYGPSERMSEQELKRLRARYAAEVTMVDTWFGKFIDKVRELGLLDNSLLVITSDHGIQLGERGVMGKCLLDKSFREVLDAVLMIRHPGGIGAGQRTNALAQHQDITTTALNFLNVKPPQPPYKIDGKDLMPILTGEKSKVRDYATSISRWNVVCRDDDYYFMCRINGDVPQLFDMKDDPEQAHNIASDKPEVVKRMWNMILTDAGADKIEMAATVLGSPREDPPGF